MRMLTRNYRLALMGLGLVFTLGLTGSALASEPASFEEALALATKENKVIVIDFYTDW